MYTYRDALRPCEEMISPEAELEQAFAADDIVVVCWEPGCTMHRLPHWDENKWVSYEQKAKYRRYSHGICRWHYQTYQQEVERFLAEEVEPRRERMPRAVVSGS